MTHFGVGQLVRVALTGGVPLMHFGSVQLIRIACTGRVPLWHPESVHSAVTRAGGGPPPQFGEPVQALAGTAPALNEQALSRAAAASTAPAINLKRRVLVIPVRRSILFACTGTRWNAIRA